MHILGSGGNLRSDPPNMCTLDLENVIFDALDEAANRTGFSRKLFYGLHHNRNPRRVIVMDMLGDSFSAPIGPDDDQRLTIRTVRLFGMQALRRMQTLHRLGYLHRDMKPNNFCVGRQGSGQERTVHLNDFGNA